jgi:hypothetical protein
MQSKGLCEKEAENLLKITIELSDASFGSMHKSDLFVLGRVSSNSWVRDR